MLESAIAVGAITLVIASLIVGYRLKERRRERDWASGKYGQGTALGGAAGGATMYGTGGGCGGGISCGGGASCGGSGCGGGGCGGGS